MAKAHFLYRNSANLENGIRIVFGLIWLLDAYFKFQPGFFQSFSDTVGSAAQGQPTWLSGWFSFWATTTASHPVLWASIIAFSELALAVSLIFGFMRRIGYTGGFLLSLLIWSIPEGFGGPYGPSSTDIGTGVIYATAFLMLMILSVSPGASKYTLDHYLEKKISWWHKLAEF